MRIIVDAFGGDNAPKEIVLGSVDALMKDKNLKVVLVGAREEIEKILGESKGDLQRVEIINATEVITNDESPTMAIKTKKDSSLVRALEILSSDEKANGFVSAGSTGAVLAGAFMIVGRIKGISRPALAPLLPTVRGNGVILCDCGANVDCKPVNLLHFAIMANAFAKAMKVSGNPKVALLSNGTEDKKGNELNTEAFALLKDCKQINFVGNCEGRDFMSGDFDVVVADGFNGNIALKTAEGTGNAIFELMKQGILSGGIKTKLGALLIKPVLREIKHKMDYNQQGGACFLGINKVVVKAHGASTRTAICASILQASKLASDDICEKIKTGIVDNGN